MVALLIMPFMRSIRFLVICTMPFMCLPSCTGMLPFQRLHSAPIVVITFDDADPSVYAIAFKTMRAIDTTWAATHFFPTSYLRNAVGLTLEQVSEMERAGWESGGHSVFHENLASLPIDTVRRRVRANYEFLVENNLSHESFAYPYGNYNDEVKSVVGEYFKNIRTSHDFEYLDDPDRTELGYYAVTSECTPEDVIDRIGKAKTFGAPLVIIGFHIIVPDTSTSVPSSGCKENIFLTFLQYLKNEELTVTTVKDAMWMLFE